MRLLQFIIALATSTLGATPFPPPVNTIPPAACDEQWMSQSNEANAFARALMSPGGLSQKERYRDALLTLRYAIANLNTAQVSHENTVLKANTLSEAIRSQRILKSLRRVINPALTYVCYKRMCIYY